MNDFVVVAYYTPGSIYEEYARNLVHSCEAQNISYKVVPVPDRGSWERNTSFKPTFLRQVIDKVAPVPIVYVDADAIFCRPPTLFTDLAKDSNVHLAAHLLDHNLYRRKGVAPELLSGTVYLANNPTARYILDEWIVICKENPKMWDQVALHRVAKKYGYFNLPPQYCMIFDYMESVKDPVIKHFQASREYKAKGMKRKHSDGPRRVDQHGTVRIRRVHG